MKLELGFAYYCTRKMEFESLGPETQTKNMDEGDRATVSPVRD